MDDTTDKYCNYKTTDCLITSTKDLYKGLNFPKRFECPCKYFQLFFPSDLFRRFFIITLDAFTGYGIQREQKNCMYRTTNSDYGFFTPSPHSVPSRYCSFFNENDENVKLQRLSFSLSFTLFVDIIH